MRGGGGGGGGGGVLLEVFLAFGIRGDVFTRSVIFRELGLLSEFYSTSIHFFQYSQLSLSLSLSKTDTVVTGSNCPSKDVSVFRELSCSKLK